MLKSKIQLAPPTKNVIMAVLTPKLVIQLTAFVAFETGRKLNFVCCIYVHFPKFTEQIIDIENILENILMGYLALCAFQCFPHYINEPGNERS